MKLIKKIEMLIYVVLIIASVFLIFRTTAMFYTALHNIDLSVNMLQVSNDLGHDWWKMEDVYNVEIDEKMGNVNYQSLPYPAFYVYSINKLNDAFFYLGLASFGLGFGLFSLINLVKNGGEKQNDKRQNGGRK
jgi:hypothetical protein